MNASLSTAGKTCVAALLVGAVGVVLQILGGADYPAVPPVLFILLVPAGLIAFGRWWWTPLTAVVAGLFLTFGTFASGESRRLFSWTQPVDATGLWLQLIAVVVATIAGAMLTIRNYRHADIRRFVRQTRRVLAKRTCQILGVFFVLIGIVGFVVGQEDFGMYHNLLHLFTGLIALPFGFAGSIRRARIASGGFAVLYLAISFLGIAFGNAAMSYEWDAGLFTVSIGDHVFHGLIGVLFLAGAVFTSRAATEPVRAG